MDCPIPDNEQERLAALARYGILDTPGEACFDRLTSLASEVFQAPIAQLNFVDRTRVWPKASHGMQIEQFVREQSFCAHAILADNVMLVPNPLEDSRFFDNPFVTGPPRLRFYAGAPIKTADGFRLGTVCVYDTVPRHNLETQRLAALEAIAGIALDELEQRRATLARRAAGIDWYRAIFEASLCGFALSDPAGNLVDVNPAFCDLSGYTREELIGQPSVMALPPDARQRAVRIQDGVLCGAVYPPLDSLIQRKDGRSLQVLVLDAPISRPGGNYCLSAFMDVSELKQSEEQIRRLQKLEAVRRLAGGVAHNINNLLTIIIGYCQILADSLESGDSRRRYSDEISNAAERAALITGQLLSFSRHGVASPRVLEVNEVIGRVERQIREILGDKVVYAAKLRPEAGNIRAGAGQVEQVLKNLAQNAREAMPEGGRFSVETARVVLDEDYALLHPNVHAGEYALITVTDTGHGMDEETRSHLFEPYFTNKGVGKGTGLAIVYGIVRQCAGDLAIYSEPGGGTTIGVFLPKAEEAAPVRAVTLDSPARGDKLLLVENQPDVLAVIRAALESQGHAVIAAESGEEALRIWDREQQHIRAVICDVVLPRMTGPELAETMVAKRPGLRVLYVSWNDNAAVSRLNLARRTLFLEKPFKPEALGSRLRELLGPEVANSH